MSDQLSNWKFFMPDVHHVSKVGMERLGRRK